MNGDQMDLGANVVAILGASVCAVAGASRVLGTYHVLGFEAMTLFVGGIGLMVFAALIKLQVIKTMLAR